DIAIGTARVLGFRLRENFDHPYWSLSTAEFWRRWHMSLSSWFRDYVYIPLGGNQVGTWRWIRKVLVTLGFRGFWPGANWTYVVWGLLNGVYLIAGKLTHPVRNRIGDAVGLPEGSLGRRGSMLFCTLALTSAAWIFFRAQSVADAWYVLTHW